MNLTQNNLVRGVWEDYLRPLVRRPNRFQVGALCYRGAAGRGREVLLITSRDTGRWIIPKGWPIDNLNAVEAAVHEAWEEAGVRPGAVGEKPVGTFVYTKRLNGGAEVACDVRVFPVEVSDLVEDFPEAHQRRRAWMAPRRAAELVEEPGLRGILSGFA
ncbi:NUDIX hydrolase [Minwuia sp.]|uniref:NUDIX hydrolase n=1 Tax=Minwuia sp. TaxID=2493630 RepID=UPI003A93BF48